MASITTRQGSLTTATNALDPIVGNTGPLHTAMEVADSISDIGRAVPFIAPAFVLLKIIIDIERRAQEVDLKCNDLVERIAFMLSHLPILKEMEIMPPTRAVIERINEALKEAAALISAYRKQSRVARRLSLSNRERFTLCVDTVNQCCSDLLMSLQIHQSKQLEILTRAVPLDEEDQAAATFVEEHGGDFEAVKYDRELVKEFAEQRNLDMDDSVMEQLEGNVSEVVQEIQVRLETIIKDNVVVAIAEGFKSLAASQFFVPTEPEQRFVCVQCEASFTLLTNGPKACSFHRADYDSWSKSYACCDTKHPCQHSSHRQKHHCDYPYGTFFPRARGINNYTDTHKEWTSVVDTDLEDDDKVQKASVSELWRWVSRGGRVNEQTILISVGRIWFTEKYYFNTFTVPQLENISKSVRHSRRTLIYRTSSSEEEYAMAEWLLSVSGKITGVRITAKAATSSTPFVRICPLDLSTGKKSGDILAISDGGMRSYAPASPYKLPETVRIGPELSDEQTRSPRTDFKTRAPPSLRVILRNMADPPLTANPKLAGAGHDFYQGSVSVFNNNAPGSNIPVTIAGAKAAYRYVGEREYKPATGIKLEAAYLPATIDPRQSFTLNFEVQVPRTEEDAKAGVQWWNRSFGARHRPIRIKLIVEEIEGEEASLVLEYVFKPFLFDKPRGYIATFHFDDPDTITRNQIVVETSSDASTVVRIDGTDIPIKRLQKVVYQSLRSGKTEIELEGREKMCGVWEWKALALVDLSCRRVYAFKILLQQGKLIEEKKKQLACLGYVLCPEYGENVKGKSRPISYATEVVTMPKLEPFVDKGYKQDDTYDDFKPPIPPKPTLNRNASGAESNSRVDSSLSAYPNGGMLQVPDELNQRLGSLDTNLGRIADALELLVAALQAKAT